MNQTLRDHQKERLQTIQGTPGFGVDDFDYSMFGKRPKVDRVMNFEVLALHARA
jgi:hypothetical protein